MTVLDKLAESAASKYQSWPPFDEMFDNEKQSWRNVVRSVLEDSIELFLQRECDG